MKQLLTLLLLAALVACEKNNSTTAPRTIHEVVIHPDGQQGKPYRFNVWTVYSVDNFDSTAAPLTTISGTVDTLNPYVRVTMSRDEFFYIIGYRTEARLDSFYTFNQQYDPTWTVLSVDHSFHTINRTESAGVSIVAGIY